MKNIKIILFLQVLCVVFFITCADKSINKNELSYIKKYDGKYPKEVNFLEDSSLKPRLVKMLGKRYDFIKRIWDVENPIKVSNGLLYAWGMQIHSGGDPSAIIIVNIKKNVIYAAIRENGKVKIFSEDGSEVPDILKNNNW